MKSLFCVSCVIIEDGKLKCHCTGLRIASSAEEAKADELLDVLEQHRANASILVHPIVEGVTECG